MRKKRVFIGSSSEELPLAEIAKDQLSAEFDVTIWNDNLWDTAVFRLNQNFLSDLLKASLQFDFGILLGTADDKVEYRGKEVLQPRDNVLFELGLFIGRLGTSKCAFVIDKEVKFPSDLQGITLARFTKAEASTFVEAIEQVKSSFLASSESEINFFPSATLAAVYFENLISPICRHIIENGGFTIEDKLFTTCVINVIVPDRINIDVNLQFEKLKDVIPTKNVTFRYAGRPRNISIDTQAKGEILEFIDFPTIITGINYSIANLLPNDFTKLSPNYDAILDRELSRFITTLKLLLAKSGFDRMVNFKRTCA
jgi:hypothetical protein